VSIKGQRLLGRDIDAKVTAICVNNEQEANLLHTHFGDDHNEKNRREPEERL